MSEYFLSGLKSAHTFNVNTYIYKARENAWEKVQIDPSAGFF